MENNNINFLIRCDKNLNMMNIYWNSPIYLISPYQRSLLDLIEVADGEKLRNSIEEAMGSDELFFYREGMKLRNSDDKISICVMVLASGALICGVDFRGGDEDLTRAFIEDIVFRFMDVIRVSDCEVLADGQETIRLQFEHIQKLNSQLLNMQRQNKKVNAELKRLNRDLNNRLVKDSLTGLVSRYQYRQEVELKIRSLPDKLGVFLFVDIDNFKRINDNYGHAVGDIYLKVFANRLKGLNFPSAVYMRIAGDEFGIYIHGYDSFDEEEADEVWTRIREDLTSRPMEIEGASLEVSCSVGMALYGTYAKDIYSLIEYADFAMYEAKNSGKNSYSLFDLDRYMASRNT